MMQRTARYRDTSSNDEDMFMERKQIIEQAVHWYQLKTEK